MDLGKLYFNLLLFLLFVKLYQAFFYLHLGRSKLKLRSCIKFYWSAKNILFGSDVVGGVEE